MKYPRIERLNFCATLKVLIKFKRQVTILWLKKKANAKFYKTVPTESMSPLGNKSAIFVRNKMEFDQKAAIEFLNEKLKPNDQVLVKGVFELLSLFVKMNENED